MSQSRRLAAILAADVAGYSRLMGADEEGTLERLKALRRELIDPNIAKYRGRIVKTTGDGMLVEFASVVDAVRCAAEVQQAMPERNVGVPADNRIALRIGINLGDVIADGDDLYGDGVNIAARIEALADAGGVFVSGTVYDHVRDRLSFDFEDRGEQQVKNIARPIRVYRVLLDVAAQASARKPAPVSEKPSIAVLPFTNLSGDIEQEYFADGVADDIITELARVRSLFVIARNSSFAYKGRVVDVRLIARELGVRYILEGSVRRGVDRLRVTAQLADAETGNHLWADRYDRPLQDLFAVQDEIALAVTKAISPAVAEAEQRRALRKPPENLGAWEAYQRGLWHLLKYSADDIAPARELFNRAIQLDPTLASAHIELARLYVIESGGYGLRPFEEAALLQAEQARIAVKLDPNDANTHAMLAYALHNCQEIEAALDHIEVALSISPSCATAHQTRGYILNFSGHPTEGRESFLLAIQHDPRGMKLLISSNIGMTYYFERDYEKAADSFRRTLADNPTDPQALRWFAAALGQLGRIDEARAALTEARAKSPDAFERWTRQRPPWYRRAEDYEHMLDGLRKAGWQG
jgi:adenylate cyclase